MDRKKSMHPKACTLRFRHLIVCVLRNLCILDAGNTGRWITAEFTGQRFKISYHSRISSVGRALDCRAGGRGFDFRDWTNTRGLKMTEK